MNKRLLAWLVFSSAMVPSCLAQTIIIKKGDNLSEIADKYKVTVRSIMDLNGIYDAGKLKIGQQIRLPEAARSTEINSHAYHTVKSGDTLERLAYIYKVKVNEIAMLNNIYDKNFLYQGQKLKLPKNAIKKEVSKNLNNNRYHTVEPGESLSIIAKNYNIPLKELILVNGLSNPNMISPGTKIYFKKDINNSSRKLKLKSIASKVDDDWRKYGSLKINWSEWKVLDGSYVTPAINKEGKPLFLAINCSSYKINSTGKNNKWNSYIKR